MGRWMDWLIGANNTWTHRKHADPDRLNDQQPLRGRRGMICLVGRNLSRSFGNGSTRAVALDSVNMELRQGEVHLLMGPSGSGKSTLLAVLSGLLRPDQGQVFALGRDIWQLTEEELERFRLRYCSYIFQGYNLFPALSAREQLEIVLKWGEGCSQREARKRADYVLGRLGLTHRAHLRPAELSGGEKQRVAIGRALVKNPTFIFADEPTAALDWDNGQQAMQLLCECARHFGSMVLVVTHDPRLIPFADRVFELNDGRLHSDNINSSALPHYDHTPLPLHKKGPRLHLQFPCKLNIST
jgi:putative ABC transport system ATP-binding protein